MKRLFRETYIWGIGLGTSDRTTVRCPSIGSCMILIQPLRFGDLLSRVTDFGSGSVLSQRSGEPEADGTGDRKTVRCPTLGVSELWGSTLWPEFWNKTFLFILGSLEPLISQFAIEP